MSTVFSRSAWPLLSLAAALAAVTIVNGQASVDADTLARMLSLPRSVHQSRIRADYDAQRDRTRVWLDTNEDDARLWSVAGQQMDVEMRISAWVPGQGPGWPDVITIDFASLGSLALDDREDALELVADGRPVAITRGRQHPTKSSSS